MSDAEEGSASSSDSSTVPPWRAQGSGPPPEVISSSATESEDNGDPDQPIPEWKKKFKAMTKERGEQPISPPTHPPPKEGSEEKEVPEWMKKFQTMKQKNPGLDESVSDWSVQSEHQRPTTTAPKQEESSLDDSNLPEWKKKLMQFKKRDHPIEPSKPKSTEKEEDQPEWMKKFKAMHLDESERETPVSENQSKQQSPAPVPVPVPAPPASADDENIPEWKRKLQEMEKRKSITEGSNLPSESQMEEIESPNLPPESQTEEMEGEDTGAYQEAEAPFPESEEAPVTSIRATQPDQISTQVPTQPVTTEESLSSNEVRADDIYGSLEKTDDQLKEEAKRESIYAERTEQLPTEEFIEEEIVYESEYEEEVVELPEEEEYEEIVEIEEPSVPQGFTNGAPAPDIQRPIPQPLHADGSQFHPSSTSAFESSLYASQRPPPPPGAPPLRHFPPPPDPPLHEERSQQAKEERMAAEPTLRKESLDAEPEDLDGSVVSITDEEMDILNEIWENEMQKEAEREEKLGEGEWQDPLHKPLLLTEEDHIGYEQKGGDEENPQIFEDEYVYPEEYKRQCWESPVVMCCVCLIFLILLGFAILLLLWLLVDDITLWEDDKPTGPPTPPFVGDLPTTPMDPYFPGQCQTPGQIQPNVLTQCECDGRISSIQPDVRAKYEALRDTFIPRLYPDWTLPIESCDSANQALFFLATSLATDESDLLQRYALAYLFYQTNGPQWRSRENWLTNTDVCLWYGIACANGLVSIVGLENNRIAGVIPWELSLLTAIQNLNLDRNNITGTIPGELFMLPILRQLSLSSNRFQGSIPRNVGFARNLEVLRLDNNDLAGPISPQLGRATSLRELDLGNNDFSNVIPQDLYRLTRLRFLSFEGNIRLAGRIPTEFGQFTDLEFFSISNTTIRARIPREYEALTKLTDLRMANTLVGGNIPDEISVLTDLFNADLADSRFRQTIPTILGNFRNMSVLLLNNNGLTGEIPSELGLLTKLTTLLLNGNELRGTIPSEVGDLSMLQTLMMEMNPDLTGRVPTEVCDLRSLQLAYFTIDCPTRDSAPICPIPYCCTSCVMLPPSGDYR